MIINLSSYKGGVGKTTLTTNLACLTGSTPGFSEMATILDLDGLQSSINFNKIREAAGQNPLKVLTAKTEQELQIIINEFQEKKLLIIDSAGVDSDITRLAAIASNVLICPTSSSVVEVMALTKYADFLRQTSKEYKQPFKANIVINNVDVRSKADITELKHFIKNNPHFDLFKTVIHNRVDFKRAFANGQSVNELDNNSKATTEIRQLFKEIQKEF